MVLNSPEFKVVDLWVSGRKIIPKITALKEKDHFPNSGHKQGTLKEVEILLPRLWNRSPPPAPINVSINSKQQRPDANDNTAC